MEQPLPSSTLELPTGSVSSKATGRTAAISRQSIYPRRYNGLKVFYASSTTVDNLVNVMKVLAKYGAQKTAKVQDCHYLCVGHGKELTKSANLILAVAMRKYVISERWAKDSAAQARLLDPLAYLAEDPVREPEWGTRLREASERGQ